MRLAPWVALAVLIPIGGCHDVRVARGLPVLAKDPDGVLISGAEGLPDIERGNQARLAGRLEDAERDLLPLAERGYVDAQFYLAAVYAQSEPLESQDLAIQWYRTVLPRRPDAVVPLSNVLMRRGDRASAVEANDLLLHAKKNVDATAVNAALLDLYSISPALDVKKRGAALARTAGASSEMRARAAAINWYRSSIAEPGNARKLVELCQKNLANVPECFVDLTTYYRYSGNIKALADLMNQAMRSLRAPAPSANFDDVYYDPVAVPSIANRIAMALVDQPAAEDLAQVNEDLSLTNLAEREAEAAASDDGVDTSDAVGAVPQYADAPAPMADGPPLTDPSPQTVRGLTTTTPPSAATAQPELADKLLRWMLKQPGAMPVEAASVAVEFPYLLPDVNLEAVLQAGVKAHIPRASLYIGQLYYFNQRLPREATLGETNLLRAVRFSETAAPGHYRLGRLYQAGYLGQPDPQKALDNLLYAARRRVTAADTHLARMFYASPGVRVDRVNSYIFARLSEDAGVPVLIHSARSGTMNVYRLLDRLRAELTPEELHRAETMYQQERAVHLVRQPTVPPEVWAKKFE